MVVGITGGMGCGKSTAAAMFADLGWGRVDSDEVVRDLLRSEAAVQKEVRNRFSENVFCSDGSVDRRRLAEVVFPSREALADLEAILHPRVRLRWKAAVAVDHPANWVVEIPLLFEKGLEKEVDFTLCVASDAEVQTQRLASRGLSPQEVSQRIARQLPLAQKIERADFVLTNNGSLAFLNDQVVRLATLLVCPAV